MKRISISLLLTICTLQAVAFSGKVEIGGVWYFVLTKGALAIVAQGDTKSTGQVVIPESIEYEGTVCRVRAIEEGAFANSPGLTSIDIRAELDSIGGRAFAGCQDLTAVNLPKGLKEIKPYTFNECQSLVAMSLPDSTVTIGERAFADCTTLREVAFSTGLKTIGERAFEGCTALKEASFSAGLDTIGARAFAGCTALASIDFNVDLQCLGDEAFEGCHSLREVSLHPQVWLKKGVFKNCSGLTTATSMLKSSEAMGEETFSGCTALRDLYILHLAYNGYSFKGCDMGQITLHCDENDILWSRTVEPWRHVKDVQKLTVNDGLEQCATPVIYYQDGVVGIYCETPDSEPHITFIPKDSQALTMTALKDGKQTISIPLQRTVEMKVYFRGTTAFSSPVTTAVFTWQDGDVLTAEGVFEGIIDGIGQPTAGDRLVVGESVKKMLRDGRIVIRMVGADGTTERIYDLDGRQRVVR